MFNFLKGAKDQIQITLDRAAGIYLPGETVHAAIHIAAAQELKVRSGYAQLMQIESYYYDYQTTQTDSDGDTTTTTSSAWGKREIPFDRQAFLDETVLYGDQNTYHVACQLPESAFPTCRGGEITGLVWKLQVVLDRKLAGDVHGEAEVIVLCAPVAGGEASRYGVSNQPHEASLALELPGLNFVTGKTIQGRLHIEPGKDFGVSEVRLELERRENVSYEMGNQSTGVVARLKLAGKTKLQAGAGLALPFELLIPDTCPPTAALDRGTISWRLRGVLARTLRVDTIVEVNVSLYTG